MKMKRLAEIATVLRVLKFYLNIEASDKVDPSKIVKTKLIIPTIKYSQSPLAIFTTKKRSPLESRNVLPFDFSKFDKQSKRQMKLITISFILFFPTFIMAQKKFHVNISGNVNVFLRTDLQLEIPVTYNASIGFKVRNYPKGTKPITGDGYSVISPNQLFLLFKGNTFDVFGRWNLNKDEMGIDEGWFCQAKFGFGNYQNPLFNHENDAQTKQNYTKQSFNTYGGGVGAGYKTVLFKYFTLELYGGLRFYTPPTFVRAANFQPLNYNGDEEYARKSWFISRSFPIELSWKIGFQI